LKQLLQLILTQLDKKGSLFGIPKDLFFTPNQNDIFRSKRFGQLLETPIGVAAGPHTQMAQNIVAAWLTGARFIELKTIQTLDELEVSKPCIDMQDEGYNCEWSQELKIKESVDQYLNAWIIIHILKDKFGWDTNEPGVIFNMSVGYDYKGILNENVQWFFNKMADSSVELNQKIESIRNIYPNIDKLSINPRISDNITLSTMHGCPPEEIEQIGEYLITEKKLHTAIKLNPTLLGKEQLQEIIKNSGFETHVPDIAFEHDLKYTDAVRIIKKLLKKADEFNLQFSLKLTNTLESLNHKNIFPENEKMMYASGRVLHPISVNVAKKLQNDFNGALDISFSAGIDAFNIANVISCGMYPATVCSDILKPGGYGRLNQYIDKIKELKPEKDTNSNLQKLNKYAEQVLHDNRYKKADFQEPSIKTKRELKAFDCIHAPCVDTCPTNQDIPDYMYHTANGNFDKAFEIIRQTNPFPATTGMVCDHICQTKCTRINYDSPLLIREIKRFVTENAKINSGLEKLPANNHKVAIIGAGPSGLSCAYFLALAGFSVDVYEAKPNPGGMASAAIPAFRLTDEAIDIDINRIKEFGVKIYYNHKINTSAFDELRKNNDFIYIAAGAQESRAFNIKGSNAKRVLDPLEFLFNVKAGKKVNIGNNIAIIGGGNTAMDAARTANRLVGKNGKVTIIYRRTMKQMPANFVEIQAVMNEGIEIIELAEPISVNNTNGNIKSLTCTKMKLGEKDDSGRARPVKIPNSEFEIELDTVIPAVGQNIAIDFLSEKKLKTKQNSFETQIPNIFLGGDALNGGLSAIAAVGDGRKTAQEIIDKIGIDFNTRPESKRAASPLSSLMTKKAVKTNPVKTKETALTDRRNFKLITSPLSKEEAIKEASRCLLCDEVCNICTTVCPNLAFHSYEIKPVKYELPNLLASNGKLESTEGKNFEITQKYQILHIADWCNQCGNCNTFCPSSGTPYKEKPHLHLTKESFDADTEGYYYLIDEKTLFYKENNQLYTLNEFADYYQFKTDKYNLHLDKKTFSLIKHEIKEKTSYEIPLQKAAEMSVVLKGIQSFYG
ncbi:MAG: putative selenate reductase subunit YgfK, partial [Bacteroidota bacterium]